MNTPISIILGFASLFFILIACTEEDSNGIDGDSDVASENERSESNVDEEAGIETPADTWLDEETGLLWANPEADDNDIEVYPDFDMHADYCDTYALGGYDDWRLPTISELRTLIVGCPTTKLGGECGITDECLDYFECRDDACSGCEEIGAGHCYWPNVLEGPCDRYAASDRYLHLNKYLCYYYVDYRNGVVATFPTPNDCIDCQDDWPDLYIRCVREWE